VKQRHTKDRLVKIYEAPAVAEAIVVRGLLKSVGIYAPDFDMVDPFPLHDPPEGWHSSEIWVPESQAEEARRIIAESRMKR
jgi:Putative prokaryotic signal transducing protein